MGAVISKGDVPRPVGFGNEGGAGKCISRRSALLWHGVFALEKTERFQQVELVTRYDRQQAALSGHNQLRVKTIKYSNSRNEM